MPSYLVNRLIVLSQRSQTLVARMRRATAWTSPRAPEETIRPTSAPETRATSVAMQRRLTNLLARRQEEDAWTSAPVLGKSRQGFVGLRLGQSGQPLQQSTIEDK